MIYTKKQKRSFVLTSVVMRVKLGVSPVCSKLCVLFIVHFMKPQPHIVVCTPLTLFGQMRYCGTLCGRIGRSALDLMCCRKTRVTNV